MPIYEYNCPKCGDFEAMQRMSDKPLRKCPSCSGKVTKLISSTSFQLKGSGWYVTDYARKGSSGTKANDKNAGDSTSDSTSSAKSEAGSTDKKTATKAAAA